jgi:hypothetical protein
LKRNSLKRKSYRRKNMKKKSLRGGMLSRFFPGRQKNPDANEESAQGGWFTRGFDQNAYFNYMGASEESSPEATKAAPEATKAAPVSRDHSGADDNEYQRSRNRHERTGLLTRTAAQGLNQGMYNPDDRGVDLKGSRGSGRYAYSLAPRKNRQEPVTDRLTPY